MSEFWATVGRVKENIAHELPGSSAQNRMSPSLPSGLLLSRTPNSSTRDSAVLICLFPNSNSKTSTILIKRTVYNGAHSGQVSFPGGKYEEGDSDLSYTALRETQEEIGISSEQIVLIGKLTPLFVPVSNLMVTPYVGYIESLPALHLNVQEVEYTIEVAIEEFNKIENKSVKTMCINQTPISAPYYSISGEQIWGITAMIISEFSELF
ncbi:MAG TPA: CoA pyrophosphatase [Tenuifilaceae bacterium]|nr:CoA pyrophosphatase [Tenuifilaceae bacterium]HPE18953.1 CoA pyrophosphatase [Tenuifilaceae bacterium]HPJ46412.1 CoA pyrophosphatase [Tenuifilaceae bacterium]HPQ34597.1 CoA pyrophosphatase [Tenuifilaceae bacterium]HRX67433.1 CoA pyrophosphatase [Tenuifilaceae bacterium]